MHTFHTGDRVATESGITGTVIDASGEYLDVLWDSDADGGPYEDEVHRSLLTPAS